MVSIAPAYYTAQKKWAGSLITSQKPQGTSYLEVVRQRDARILPEWAIHSERMGPIPHFPGAGDFHYLSEVIQLLKEARMQRKTKLRDLARSAELKPGLISKAEAGHAYPTVREFKAWAQALGLKWNDICDRAWSHRIS